MIKNSAYINRTNIARENNGRIKSHIKNVEKGAKLKKANNK
jgi:hypothetical protein